jgi:hypothetical protein
VGLNWTPGSGSGFREKPSEPELNRTLPSLSGVLLAASRHSGTVRRRRDVAVPCDDYCLDFSFIAIYFCWDVLRIRPIVLINPSLVTELSSRAPRHCFFCCDQMIFATDLFFLPQQPKGRPLKLSLKSGGTMPNCLAFDAHDWAINGH